MLEADGLSKRYEDGQLALDHVSFGVMPGQVYAMLGGNGAGKTTTIHLFLSFIEPTAGEARIAGHHDRIADRLDGQAQRLDVDDAVV